jgi:hypothetical protein
MVNLVLATKTVDVAVVAAGGDDEDVVDEDLY